MVFHSNQRGVIGGAAERAEPPPLVVHRRQAESPTSHKMLRPKPTAGGGWLQRSGSASCSASSKNVRSNLFRLAITAGLATALRLHILSAPLRLGALAFKPVPLKRKVAKTPSHKVSNQAALLAPSDKAD